jgi:hypothetical protein
MPACLSSITNPKVIVAKKMKPYIKNYVFNDKHENYFKSENDAFFENHKIINNLYNANYLRISIGQRAVTPNIFLIDDDSEDESTEEDNALDTGATDTDADTEEDNALDTGATDTGATDTDTEDDAADTISYEYNYTYNYTYN